MAGRKGRSGFGSARKLPSGRWQARYFGPDMSYHSGPATFQTKCDAQAWLAGERQLISRQEWTSPQKQAQVAAAQASERNARTLSVYAEAWLAGGVTSSGAALRPTTEEGYRNALDLHILPAFGHLPLDEVTSAAVRAWRGRFSAEGRDATGAKTYSLLKAILQTAEDDELILRNPCRLKGAGSASKRRESIALTPSELADLVAAMPKRWRALTMFLDGVAFASPRQPGCAVAT
jgi:hypothetical protein